MDFQHEQREKPCSHTVLLLPSVLEVVQQDPVMTCSLRHMQNTSEWYKKSREEGEIQRSTSSANTVSSTVPPAEKTSRHLYLRGHWLVQTAHLIWHRLHCSRSALFTVLLCIRHRRKAPFPGPVSSSFRGGQTQMETACIWQLPRNLSQLMCKWAVDLEAGMLSICLLLTLQTTSLKNLPPNHSSFFLNMASFRLLSSCIRKCEQLKQYALFPFVKTKRQVISEIEPQCAWEKQTQNKQFPLSNS